MPPSIMPITADMPTAMNPIERDIRAPYIMRASTSLPLSSVPKGCSPEGGFSIDMRLFSVGLYLTGGNTAKSPGASFPPNSLKSVPKNSL